MNFFLSSTVLNLIVIPKKNAPLCFDILWALEASGKHLLPYDAVTPINIPTLNRTIASTTFILELGKWRFQIEALKFRAFPDRQCYESSASNWMMSNKWERRFEFQKFRPDGTWIRNSTLLWGGFYCRIIYRRGVPILKSCSECLPFCSPLQIAIA